MLHAAQLLPQIQNITLGRAKVSESNNRKIIALPIKDSASTVTDKEILMDSIHSLLNVITEIGIQNISICKSDIDYIP